MRMKFSALNVDFGDLSLDYLGSRKLAHEGIKEQYSRKSRYFTVQVTVIGFRAFREH